MHPIPEILEELRQGRMIVLVDDEDRENEGDLVCAAQAVTPGIVNFMLKEARGLLCLALLPEECDRLDLPLQTYQNTTRRSTAFTVSIDAHEKFGVSTGVSASDRASTIQVAIDPKTRPADLVRPGHIHPLRARKGGVLVRAGHTEGSVDLCRLAGLNPAAVIIEIMNDDGSMARLPELRTLAAKHGLKMCSIADIIQYQLERQRLVERIAQGPLQTPFGEFRLLAYRSLVDPLPHVALVKGDAIGQLDARGVPVEIDRPVLVRMHSQNLLGDVFGDLTQPSGQTLRKAMEMIQAGPEGAIVYLRHEGMGAGLLKSLQTSWNQGRSGQEERPYAFGHSHTTPGIRPAVDKRDYGVGSQILRDLGISRMRLLTDHPFHPAALSGFGLAIDGFVPLHAKGSAG